MEIHDGPLKTAPRRGHHCRNIGVQGVRLCSPNQVNVIKSHSRHSTRTARRSTVKTSHSIPANDRSQFQSPEQISNNDNQMSNYLEIFVYGRRNT
jgi:hypothetical protein